LLDSKYLFTNFYGFQTYLKASCLLYFRTVLN